MNNDDLQTLLSERNREIDELYARIEQLKGEMDQVLDTEREVRRADGAFTEYISQEKELANNMSTNERVRSAVGFGDRMNRVIKGANYRLAVSGFEDIKKALKKSRDDIERSIEQCRRRISVLQDSVRTLNQQLSPADWR